MLKSKTLLGIPILYSVYFMSVSVYIRKIRGNKRAYTSYISSARYNMHLEAPKRKKSVYKTGIGKLVCLWYVDSFIIVKRRDSQTCVLKIAVKHHQTNSFCRNKSS